MRWSSIVVLLLAASCRKPLTVEEKTAAAITAADPGLSQAPQPDGTLKVSNGDVSVVLGFDNLRAQCKSEPDRCDALIARTVRSTVQRFRAKETTITRAQVRAVLKNADDMKAMTAVLRPMADGGHGNDVVTHVWLGELHEVYVVDTPDTILMLSRSNQNDLGLDDKELDALALKNLSDALPQPALTPIDGEDDLFAIYEGDDYANMQLLFPERFAALTKKLGGALIVTVPVRNILFATGRTDSQTLDHLAKLTQTVFETKGHPLSKQLLEWSPAGFHPHSR